KFSAAISEKMGILETPAENASLTYDKGKEVFALKSAKTGKIVDKNSLQAEILSAMAEFRTAEIAVKMIDDFPQVDDEETEAAKEKAESILTSAPYVILTDDFKTKLQKEDILDFLEFVPVEGGFGEIILGVGFVGEEMKNYLISLAPSINREPVNAVLAYESGKIKEFALSKDGIVLKIDESVLKIKDAFETGEKEITLEVERTKPLITTDSIENLGITSLLAKGESDFAGSPKSRVHNIKIGAAKFNGVLLKPGEEFSFNAILGEVDEKGGYLPELVIKQNKTTPEYGGGICQVSTTAFRGAMFAGLEILERAPHSFPVRYYNPQGFDATVYPPSPDFKFKNNTPAHLLIQTRIKSAKIFFEFYGMSDGRTVKIDGPRILEKKEDGSMKTVLYREIYDKDGNLLKKSVFRSNYKSPDLYPIERNPLE
ncbi:MAG: VanW family protein, partial [Patescibacteria group bacterium]